jgi:hypothetical protein
MIGVALVVTTPSSRRAADIWSLFVGSGWPPI